MKITIDVLGYEDSFYHTKVTRPFGYVERRSHTPEGLKDYIDAARMHCEYKKYEFELKGMGVDGIQ